MKCTLKRENFDNPPMGRYSDRDGSMRLEYQIGTRLIWVRCRPEMPETTCLESARQMLAEAWVSIPDVMALAEAQSRRLIPDFWSIHDNSKRAGNRLDIWGITLAPHDLSVRLDVSRNHKFDFHSATFAADDYWNDTPIYLPDLPDQHHIYVDRSPSGVLSVSDVGPDLASGAGKSR